MFEVRVIQGEQKLTKEEIQYISLPIRGQLLHVEYIPGRRAEYDNGRLNLFLEAFENDIPEEGESFNPDHKMDFLLVGTDVSFDRHNRSYPIEYKMSVRTGNGMYHLYQEIK